MNKHLLILEISLYRKEWEVFQWKEKQKHIERLFHITKLQGVLGRNFFGIFLVVSSVKDLAEALHELDQLQITDKSIQQRVFEVANDW